ncbi:MULTISPECIES: beta-ketoacyl reductase, partial [Gammaproteobacteria]|uniref:beta-ketoacyl reductase n=1 Tax=Gammaproteobacteria TaxID=1236 RepID=UPI001913FC06
SKKYFNYHRSAQVDAVSAVQKNQGTEPFITQPEISDLTYQVDWIAQDKAAADSSTRPHSAQSHWAVFLDDNPLSEAVLGKIKELDPAPLLLSRDNQRHNDDSHTLYVDTSDLVQTRAMLKDRISKDGRAINGVIYLWNEDRTRQDSEHEVIEQTSKLTQDALFSMQLVLHLQPVLTDGFNMITRGAFSITSSIDAEPNTTELTQAPLSGLMKTLSHEAPGLHPRLIDLPWHQDKSTADARADARNLLDEIISDSSGEFQIAFRENKRYVPRLNHKALATGTTIQIVPDAAYLVTGGLGDIGLRLCEWLIAQGARHLVLVNRSGVTTAHQHSTVAHLRSLGATLTLHRADISSDEEVACIMENTLQGGLPLKGIFHCAGTSGAMTKISDLHWADLKRTMEPKVDATWSLYKASKALPLDFFVSFSSISAVWGAAGLGAYASANMFLEAFSIFTRNRVIPATAVNWGPWSRTGMANAPGLSASLETSGIKPLAPDTCLNMLSSLLASKHRPITVTDTSWSQFRKVIDVFGIGRMFEHLQPAAPTAVSVEASSPPRIHPAGTIAPADIEQYLKDEVGKLLDLPNRNTINRRTGFFDLGMDSVLAAELLTRIKRAFNIDLPSTAIFENPTIQALTDHIVSCLPTPAKQPATTLTEPCAVNTNQRVQHSRTDIEQMSEQEALGLLQASLRNLQ